MPFLYASENVEVELYKDGKSIPLNSYHKTYLYGNTVEYLSTCRHLKKVTGTTYSIETARGKLARIKSGNHLKSFLKKAVPACQ
jgi:hypothetical protein